MARNGHRRRLERLETMVRPAQAEEEGIPPEIQRKVEALPMETLDRIMFIWEAVERGEVSEDVLEKALAEEGL